MDLAQLFETDLNQKLSENPELLSSSEACFQLKIDDYLCYLDLKSERKIVSGMHENPDCRMEISMKNFEKLVEGKLNIPLALATRKIKVGGNLAYFTQLRELFQ